MASPHFTDRSFVQMARRALMRSSWGPLSPYSDMLITRARLADARASLGPHGGSTRAKDRRWAIYARNRKALSAPEVAGAVRLSEVA